MSNFFLFAIDVLTINGFISIDLNLDCVSADIVDLDVDGKVCVTVSIGVAVKKIFKTISQKKSQMLRESYCIDS